MTDENKNIEREEDETLRSGSFEEIHCLKRADNSKSRETFSESLETAVSKCMVKSLEEGRTALNDNYLEIRCGPLQHEFFYLDLTGKIVEGHIGRRLDDEDLTAICMFLTLHQKVIYLNLGYNYITCNGFAYLAHYLSGESSLQTLNLIHNNILTLNEGVLRNTAPLWKLKCLIINGNKLGTEGGLAVARILRCNTSLIHLEIGETDQTLQSLPHIVESILPHFDGNRTLRKLNLSRILPISSPEFQFSFHICRLVGKVLMYNQSIVEIHLEKNGIADWDLEELLPGLGMNKILTLLNLGGNGIGGHGIELLASVLPETSLEYLMLPSNHITNSGAIALGKVLSKTKLRFLDISRNRIEDEGMLNLLWGLASQCPPVYTLFLFGNPITKLSAEILYKQTLLGHISPFAIDLQFLCSEGSFAEDRTANRYRNLYYMVHELSAYKRPLHHSCCYVTQPSVVNAKTAVALRIAYRKLFVVNEASNHHATNPTLA